MKTCSKCGYEKSESDFFIRDKKTGRLHAQCKQCYSEQRAITYKEHYQKYKQSYQNRAKLRRTEVRRDLQNHMIQYLSDKYCVICNESDPVILEFDHIDATTKAFGIANGIRNGYKWDAILDEIDKCRVLCANCHKRHTALQYGWYKNLTK